MFCCELALIRLAKLFIHNTEEVFKLILLWRWWLFFLSCIFFWLLWLFWWLSNLRIHVLIKILMSEFHHFEARLFQIFNLLMFMIIFGFIHKSNRCSCFAKNYIFVWGYYLPLMNIILKYFMVFILFKSFIWILLVSHIVLCWLIIFLYFKLIHFYSILAIFSLKAFQKVRIFYSLLIT